MSCKAEAARVVQTAGETGLGLLQRKCDCDNKVSIGSGLCEECQYGSPIGLQTKLVIGASDDPLEREADLAATQVLDMSKRLTGTRSSNAMPVISRRAMSAARGSARNVPQSVSATLRAPGEQLPAATRSFFESRFGHDFGKVRVHRDIQGSESARDIGAKAYTAGNHIVFAAGRYQPSNYAGRSLLAHELAHVIQQSGTKTVLRRKDTIENFEADKFSRRDLRDYLKKIKGGEIEDDSDSDDKARYLVKQWRQKKHNLGPKTKITLIREMQSDFTGDDDERAILTLLFYSSDRDIEVIFGAGGIDPVDLDSDFQTVEEELLHVFFDRKFVGGRKAALKGSRRLRSRKSSSKKASARKASSRAARKPDAGSVREGEKDIVVLLDPTLADFVRIIAPGATVIRPTSPKSMAKELGKITHPIGKLFIVSHSLNNAAIAFGKQFVLPATLSEALKGSIAAGNEPTLIDFRGCRVGLEPPGMDKIRASLKAGAAVGGTCWHVVQRRIFNLGHGDVVSRTNPRTYTRSELQGGVNAAADAFGRGKKCVLNKSIDGYFRAGGKLIAAWFSGVRSPDFDPHFSRCFTRLTPEVVDPEKVHRSQSSISSKCRLIQVDK